MITLDQIKKAALDHQRLIVTDHITPVMAKVDREYNEEVNRAFAAGAEWAIKQQRWMPIAERRPEKPFPSVLATNGKNWFVCSFTKGGEIDVDIEDDDDPERYYCEQINDQFFLKEGWYELIEQLSGMYDQVWIKREIVAWISLPELYKP